MADRVEIETVTVGRGGGRELLADLYRPPAPNGAGVLLIHGGSYERGDRTQLRGYAIALGRAGYTCLACEYRLAGESLWPAQIDDVHTALAYFRGRAAALGVDAARVAVAGNSAGGQLALLAAALGEQPIAAVAAFYSAVDFVGEDARAKGAPQAMAYLVGPDVSESRLASISPLHHVRTDFPPTLLATGNQDEMIHWGESLRMYQALTNAGDPAELHIFNSAGHAFDLSPDLGRACAALLTVFLDRHVLPGPGAGKTTG